MSYNKINYVQSIFELLLLCTLALIISNNYFYGFDIYLINSHYTLSEYFYINDNVHLSEKTFPTGVEYYRFSILPYIYILFNSLIKNYQLTQQLITFIEILFFYYSIDFFIKNFFSLKISFINKILIILSVLLSEFLFVNFSMLRLPLYEGLHYQFSISFGLISLVYFKKEIQKYIPRYSIISLIISTLFHPMIGIYFFITLLILIFYSKKIYLLKFFIFFPFIFLAWYKMNIGCETVNCSTEILNFSEYRKFTSIFSMHQISLNNLNLFLNNSVLPTIVILIILNYLIRFEFDKDDFNLNLVKSFEIIIYLSFLYTLAPLTEIYSLNIIRLYGASIVILLILPIILFSIFFKKKKTYFKYFYFLFEIILISKLTIISLIFFIINIKSSENKIINKFFNYKIIFFISILLTITLYLIFNDIVLEKVNYLKSFIGCLIIFGIFKINKIQYKSKVKILVILSFIIIFKNFILLNPYKQFHNKDFRKEKENLLLTSKWIKNNLNENSLILIHPDVHDVGLLAFTKIAEFGTPRTLLFKSWNTNRNKLIFERGLSRFCDIAGDSCYEYFKNSNKLNLSKVSYFINRYKNNIDVIDPNLKKILLKYEVNYIVNKKNDSIYPNDIIYGNNDFIIIKVK